MNNILNKILPMSNNRRLAYVVILILVFLLTQARAQNGSMRNAAGLASGASSGAYGMSDLDSVGLFNGSLSFRLPLLQTAGRGGAQVPLTLSIENSWRAMYVGENPDGTPNQGIVNAPWYRASSVLTDYRPGYMLGHYTASGPDPNILPYPCDDLTPTRAQVTNTRFTFIMPNGVQYKFVSKVNNGLWVDRTGLCTDVGFLRGREFITTDGSSAIFTTDEDVYDQAIAGDSDFTASGVLMLRDGTRYVINSSGVVTSMRDRNGNQATFTYATYPADDVNGGRTEVRLTGVTDSLNRVVTIAYNQQDGGAYGLCDRITFKGFGGAERVIRVSFKELGTLLRADQTPQTLRELKIAYVWLPDGKKYQFRYNLNGELARVELPMGGAFEYDFAAGINDPNNLFGTIGDPIYQGVYRRLVEKRVYANQGDVTPESVTTFSRPETPGSYPPVSNPYPPPPGTSPTYTDFTNNLGYVDVDHLDPAKPQGSNLLSRERHFFFGSAATSMIGSGDDPWKWGKEWQTEAYGSANGTSLTLLRRVTHTWAQPPLSGWPFSQDYAPVNNSHVTETLETLADVSPSLVSKQTYLYDVFDSDPNNDFNNLLETKEYDYGSGAPGALLRRTLNTYATVVNSRNYVTDKNIHILSLPKKVQIFDGNNVARSETDYEYDRYTADADLKHANLIVRTGITGLAAGFNQNYLARGNVTAITRWILSPRRPITSYLQYDVAGNVVVTLDSLNNRTEVDYTDRFGPPTGDAQNGSTSAIEELAGQYPRTFAFPTMVNNARGQKTYTKYDYYTGQAVDIEDANGAVSSFYYSRVQDPLAATTQIDELDRIAQVINRDSKTSAPKSQVTYTYLDTQRVAKVTADQTLYKDNKLKSERQYDGLWRTTEIRAYESPTAYIKTDQKYDAMGRLSETTMPYRPNVETAAPTTISYDALGRRVQVKTADGSILKVKYAGNVTTGTDQMLRVRQGTRDALGRLTEVIEDPGTGNLNYVTKYTYDALGNLLNVQQGNTTTGLQTRTFAYDSLSRMTSATNPETGEIKYTYFDTGTLKTRSDPRTISPSSTTRVTTTYEYDALNRIKSATYNDNITPKVSYIYDDDPLPSDAPTTSEFNRGASIGRLVAVNYGTGATGSYYGYDKQGQVVKSFQVTDTGVLNPQGTTLQYYASTYAYDVGGSLISQTYPSGRTVNTKYDGAGRVSTVTGRMPTDTAATTFASYLSYTSHGAISKMRLGNGLWEHTLYNSRLQPTEIGLGTSALDSSLLKLNYTYGQLVNNVLNVTRNNGNVQSQTITVAEQRTSTGALISPKVVLKQSYLYDEVNRLLSAEEKDGTTQVWKQSYTYKNQSGVGEQFGNRRINEAGTTANVMPDFNPFISSTDNRISANQGYSYDAAGNLTQTPFNGGSHGYSYDAENRQIKLDGGTTIYTYDGEGRRVKRETQWGTTIFVYNAAGQLVSEYAPFRQGDEVGKKFLTSDHLGSTRLLTDMKKAVKARYDFLPFGEQVEYTLGRRSLIPAYNTTDTTRQKFTGQEHDEESGLDYFRARYYSSALGRFTSPDAPFIDQNRSNPQSWNLYTYVRNNPLRFTDPTGSAMYEGGPPPRTQDQDDQTEEQKKKREMERKAQDDDRDGLIWDPNKGWVDPVPVRGPTVTYKDPRGPSCIICGILGAGGAGAGAGGLGGGIGIPTIGPALGAIIVGSGSGSGHGGGNGGNDEGIESYDGMDFIDPFNVRFSQDSCSYTFDDGKHTIDDLAKGLADGSVPPNSISPIRLVRKGGVLTTLDNRRLEAFRRAGVSIPFRMATMREAVREAWKFTSKNGGTSIRVRGEPKRR